MLARTGQDQQFVLGIGADGLEELAERAVVFDAELDGATPGVGLGQQNAVGAPLPALK